VRQGSPINTEALGSLTFSVTATSKDGQKTTRKISYTVAASIRSAPRFYLQSSGIAPIAFTQLLSIDGPITGTKKCQPYINTPGVSPVCKQHGPPSLTLRAPLDPHAYKALLSWHQDARAGKPNARQDATLSMYQAGAGPGSDGSQPSIIYRLQRAWVSKLETGGVNAGAKRVLFVKVTITADSISASR
jgi:hypothetical protein